MQNNVTANKAATLTLPAPENVSGVSAAFVIYDELGVAVGGNAVDAYDPQSATITCKLTAGDNNLADGETHSGREIVVIVTDVDGGQHEVRDYFVLVNARPLTFLANTFLTYPAALAQRTQFGPTLEGWDAVMDNTTRQSALIHAHENLCRVRYAVGYRGGNKPKDVAAFGTGSDLIWDNQRKVSLRGITAEDFGALPVPFQRAVKRAQLVEANILLGGDIVGQKRKDGIISETIGESSTFFSSKPYLNLPFSRQAYEILKPYLIVSVRIGR